MSDEFNVLPIIIPFFGVTLCSGLITVCCLWRAVNSRFIRLEHRMEQLTILPISPPPPPPTPNYPSPQPSSSYPSPTYLSSTYPMYPSHTQPTSAAVPYPLYPNVTYNV
jgi:hypothetical protein